MTVTLNQTDPHTGTRKKVPLLEVDAQDGSNTAKIVATSIAHLKVAGGCVVRNLLPMETVDQIVQDFQPHLDDPETFLSECCL